jgi:AraC-like DNA-binding protein
VKEEDIAREVGLSVRQLCRLFQEQVGTSPARYFDRKRLLRAFQLLIDVSMPIKEVSYQLGFSSPAYFSHWFKSQTGTSPRTFRSQQ